MTFQILKIFVCLFALSVNLNCSKKSDSKSESNSSLNIPESLEEPSTVLASATAALASAMETNISQEMVSSLALPLVDSGFLPEDCDEHAQALARDGDDINDKDNSGRLRLHNPRMPLQDFYCKMATDTGSADSFLGAVSQFNMLFCFMGSGLVFDGKTRKRTLNEKAIDACLADRSDSNKEEMKGEMGDEVTAEITATNMPKFGDANFWDGGITMVARLETGDVKLRILLKDSDDIIALAVNDGADRPIQVDGYMIHIHKATGEIRFISKNQRIRTRDGSGSNGWNRHAVAYVKGALDSDLKFTEVTALHGAYSDISVNRNNANPTDSDAPVQMGSVWTVSGSVDEGIKSYSYDLDCEWHGSDVPSACDDVNLAASWNATAGSGACNGMLNGETCEGDGIAISKNAHTSFMMDLNHKDFETTEEWFESLSDLTFKKVSLSIRQD